MNAKTYTEKLKALRLLTYHLTEVLPYLDNDETDGEQLDKILKTACDLCGLNLAPNKDGQEVMNGEIILTGEDGLAVAYDDYWGATAWAFNPLSGEYESLDIGKLLEKLS